jgi:hypothetical protein
MVASLTQAEAVVKRGAGPVYQPYRARKRPGEYTLRPVARARGGSWTPLFGTVPGWALRRAVAEGYHVTEIAWLAPGDRFSFPAGGVVYTFIGGLLYVDERTGALFEHQTSFAPVVRLQRARPGFTTEKAQELARTATTRRLRLV